MITVVCCHHRSFLDTLTELSIDKSTKLGTGATASVYRGELRRVPVAVKVYSVVSDKFEAEVELLR